MSSKHQISLQIICILCRVFFFFLGGRGGVAFAVLWITRQTRAGMIGVLRVLLRQSIQFSMEAVLMRRSVWKVRFVINNIFSQRTAWSYFTSGILILLRVLQAMYTSRCFVLSKTTTVEEIWWCGSKTKVLCHTGRHPQIADVTALRPKIGQHQSMTVSVRNSGWW